MKRALIIAKSVNNAFIGTSVEREPRDLGVNEVVITGVITDNSVEATARMSGNLGFHTIVVSDATATFGRRDYDGVWRTAAEVHAMSLANLAPPQNLWPKDGNSWSTSGGVFVVDAQDDK